MKTSPPLITAQAERRGIVALFAIFALLIQALIPSFATAAVRGAGGTIVICSMQGMQTVPADSHGAPAKPAPGHPCENCVCPAVTAPPPAAATVLPVIYSYARLAPPVAPERLIPPARGPPRPPGQGPPTTNA